MEQMNDNNTIKLSDLLLTCLDFTADPSSENEQKLVELRSKLTVRVYLPLEEKVAAMTAILNALSLDGDNEDFPNVVDLTSQLERYKIILGLLCGYCVNLENDLKMTSIKNTIVDVLYSTGIIDSILEGCEKDYGRLCHMVEEALNFSHIYQLLNSVSMIDDEHLEEYGNTIKSLKETLTPETVEFLRDAMVAGTPEYNTLTKGINDEFVKEVMERIDKKEKEKTAASLEELTQNVSESKEKPEVKEVKEEKEEKEEKK